jgi:hypothetical protein
VADLEFLRPTFDSKSGDFPRGFSRCYVIAVGKLAAANEASNWQRSCSSFESCAVCEIHPPSDGDLIAVVKTTPISRKERIHQDLSSVPEVFGKAIAGVGSLSHTVKGPKQNFDLPSVNSRVQRLSDGALLLSFISAWPKTHHDDLEKAIREILRAMDFPIAYFIPVIPKANTSNVEEFANVILPHISDQCHDLIDRVFDNLVVHSPSIDLQLKLILELMNRKLLSEDQLSIGYTFLSETYVTFEESHSAGINYVFQILSSVPDDIVISVTKRIDNRFMILPAVPNQPKEEVRRVVFPGMAGLMNFGTACYLNSIL